MADQLSSTSSLLAEAAKSDAERNIAFVWELAAQAIMYILSCMAIVFTCVFASKRMRELSAQLEKTAIELVGCEGNTATAAADDSKQKLATTHDLSDVRITDANAAIKKKVRVFRDAFQVEFIAKQVASITRVARRLIMYVARFRQCIFVNTLTMYSAWLLLSFLARAAVYGALALGYHVSSIELHVMVLLVLTPEKF
jgi:hypothetical protein